MLDTARLAVLLLATVTSGAKADVITISPGQSIGIGDDIAQCRGSSDDCRPQVLCDECRSTSAGGRQTCTVVACDGQVQQFHQNCTVAPAFYECSDCLVLRGLTWGYVVFKDGGEHERVPVGTGEQCARARINDWRCFR